MKSYFCSIAAVLLFIVALVSLGAPFPLTDSVNKLDQQAIDKAVAEARENDVDVTTQNAILYKGLMLFQDEEYEECIPFLEEALRMDPSLTSGLEALGWAYIRTNRPQRGYDLWEYFRTLMPDSWMPYNLLAQAAIMQQDWKKADEMFRKTLEIKPDLFDQRYWFAQNLLRIGKIDEAEKIFRDLIKIEPGRLDIQIDLANLVSNKFQYDEATQIWRHINEELPGNPKFLMNQAELEVRIGELNIADSLCRDVVETENAKQLFPDEVRRAMNLMVDIADFQDSSEKSVKRLTELIEQTDDPVQRSLLRLRLANRCKVQQYVDPSLHSDEDILKIIRDAIHDNPYNQEAMELFAEQCVIAKDYSRAESSARYVLENFNRNNTRVKDVLFECALVQRRFDDADQIIYDRYEHSDPTDPSRWIAIARVQMARGDYEEALGTLDKMESQAQRGTVLTLLYHGLTESDWISLTSARRLREQVNAMRDAGFIFIAPSDIPKYAGLMEGESSVGDTQKLPWLARTLDYMVYQITGYRRFRPEDSRDFRDMKPSKYVAITFDDGLRSSFLLGSEIAEYVGAPFGMFMVTKPQKDYQPAVAGWEEARLQAETGTWQIGSHLYDANSRSPADREGKDIRRNLPNRLWLPAKNRIESMNEWDERMRMEFRKSRQIVKDEMGKLDSEVPMVSYPYGDIGNEESCNLTELRNPMKSILSEASRSYQLGFVQNQTGYTSVGDNLLMCRRYEPRWNDEGSDLVKTIYVTHPVFMARRTRIDLAIHMNKPHMAEEMIRLLRRDGYPEDLCRAVEKEVRMHFRNIPIREDRPITAKLQSASTAETVEGNDEAATPVFNPFEDDLDADLAVSGDKSKVTAERREATQDIGGEKKGGKLAKVQIGDDSPWIDLSRPFLTAEITSIKANDQFEVNRYGLRAGLNTNPNTTLSAEGFITSIDQAFHPRWNAITNDMTKVLTKHFEATKTESRIRMSHRTSSGATLSGSLGMAALDLNYTYENTSDIEDDVGSREFYRDPDASKIIGDLGLQWNPRNDMMIHLFYAKDLVDSAAKLITYDSVGGEMEWNPLDFFTMNTKAQYWSYSDNNALFNIRTSGLFDIVPDIGVKGGMEVYTITSSHACDYYWTPYWDQRATGILRYQRSYQGYDFFLDFMMGLQREDGRPLRRKQDDGLSSASDWGYIWGFRGKYDHRINDTFSVGIEGTVTALREYVDHQLVMSLTAEF